MTDSPLTPAELEWLHSMVDLARTGQTVALAKAIDVGLPVNLTTSTGDSLLILAAYNRHSDTVDMLLARNADPDRVNDRGQTALAAATFRRDREIVASLLSAGADPTTGERSAVQIADFFDLAEMKALLTRSNPASAAAADREGQAVESGQPKPPADTRTTCE